MMNRLSGLPKFYFVTAGVGRGESELTAFDNALRVAGIDNFNLIKVSSIVPPGASKKEKVDLPEGSLLPIAYGALVSSESGEVISAAVAVGLPEGDDVGVIMEFAGRVEEEEARKRVERMAEEALLNRGLGIASIEVKSVTARVEGVTCVFAGVALW